VKPLRCPLSLVAVAIFLLGAASPAHAEDPTCREETDECVIVVHIDDPADSNPPKDGDDKSPGKKVTPQCSAFAGPTVVAPAGTSPSDLLPEDRPEPGWVRVTCLLAGEEMWLWMDPGVNAEAIARTLLARLQLEPISIGWTPLRDGALGIVGVPTWLWVENPGRETWGPARISAAGVSLTARVESVTWSMGNGDEVRCANKGTPWRLGRGADPSPTCGYTYEEQGTYEVTATAHWVARWSGYGRSGSIPLSLSQERTLDVGEIQVIVTNR
jgi:hypothetical protein